jgi:hypothetical protein
LQNENENTCGTQEQSYGRSETRLHKVSHSIDALGDIALERPGITTLSYVVSFRKIGNKPSTQPLIRYYIKPAKLSGEKQAHAAS